LLAFLLYYIAYLNHLFLYYMQLKRVVVTGLGALTPIGNSLSDYWQGLVAGKSGAATITKFDASSFSTQFACELKNFNAKQHLDRKLVRKLDPFAQYALVAADEAVADAGLAEDDSVNKNRVGVIWSSGIGGIGTFQQQITDYNKRKGRFSPYFIPKMILDIAAGHISMRYGFRGMNFAVVSACASSTNALIDAFNYIRLGKADAIVTGGSEAAVTESGIGGFGGMMALSKRNDDPASASRPFDANRDGFVLGEGAGAIVVEEYEHAKKRGATIYAEVIAGGMSADAYHLTAPHPEGLGAYLVMQDALSEAQLNTDDIDYINVHGTSTPLGDISEVKAIQQLFSHHAYDLNISSTKSMTGHLLGAAGAIESIACIMAIKHGVVPPTINHFTRDEAFDAQLNFTFNQAQTRTVNVAMSNTFGFGGHNTSVVFRSL
jgi:3-oxoacyl-[acyl-carrier-protein] synthase II